MPTLSAYDGGIGTTWKASQNASSSSEPAVEETNPRQEQAQESATSDSYSTNTTEWTWKEHEQDDGSHGWWTLRKVLKQSSGDRPQLREAEKADFLVPIDRVMWMGPELYRTVLDMKQLKTLHKFVYEYTEPSSTVREFNKEFPLSTKLFKRWKHGVTLFLVETNYVRTKTSHAKSVSALELLVLARMVAVSYLRCDL